VFVSGNAHTCNGTVTELSKEGAYCEMDCGCSPIFNEYCYIHASQPGISPEREYRPISRHRRGIGVQPSSSE